MTARLLMERSRRVQSVLARGDLSDMRALISELYGTLLDVEADNDFQQSILDGSWPTAREYAERILERTKKGGA